MEFFCSKNQFYLAKWKLFSNKHSINKNNVKKTYECCEFISIVKLTTWVMSQWFMVEIEVWNENIRMNFYLQVVNYALILTFFGIQTCSSDFAPNSNWICLMICCLMSTSFVEWSSSWAVYSVKCIVNWFDYLSECTQKSHDLQLWPFGSNSTNCDFPLPSK